MTIGIVPNHRIPVGKGPGVTGLGSIVSGTAGAVLASKSTTADPVFSDAVIHAVAYGVSSASADNAAALQAAINATQAIFGTLILPPGTLDVASGLTVTAPIRIVGSVPGIGPGTFSGGTAIRSTAAFLTGNILRIDTPYGVDVEGIRFDSASTRTSGAGIRIYDGSDGTVSQGSRVLNCIFWRQFYGVWGTNCGGTVQRDCYHNAWNESAIFMEPEPYISATFTVTIASPAVITSTAAASLANNDPVTLTTTGALPTGLTVGTTYYVINNNGTTFRLAATAGGAAINTSGSQSGVHTVTHGGNECGGGVIDNVVFQGSVTPGDQRACIELQAGYADVRRCGIGGADYGILLTCVPGATADLKIRDNSLDEQCVQAIRIEMDATFASPRTFGTLMVVANELSNVNFNVATVQNLLVIDPGTRDYIEQIVIEDNSFFSNNIRGASNIVEIQRGTSVKIAGNLLNNRNAYNTGIGTNESPRAIYIGPAAVAVEVTENTVLNFTRADNIRFDVSVVFRHSAGIAFVNLPTCANGSIVYVTDGQATSAATGNTTLTSGGSGTLAAFNNGVWKTVGTTFTLGTAAAKNTGTSGNTVPLLDGANTWSATQTFTLAPVFTAQAGTRTALGLGTAATQNTGTSGANVPLLSTANTWTLAQTFSTPVATGSGGTGGTLGAAVTMKITAVTSSQTVARSTGVLFAIIEAVGGGGGGAGAGAAATGISTGGGGGSGSYSRARLNAPAASYVVTIGAGGAGGATGANNGSNGNDTTVVVNSVTICVGKAGGGGQQAGSTRGGIGGAGGVAGTGDFTPVGNGGFTTLGSSVTTMDATTALGGAGPFGGVTAGSIGAGGAVNGGGAAANSGSGGNGGLVQGSSSTAAGGNGGSGVVIITEFINQ